MRSEEEIRRRLEFAQLYQEEYEGEMWEGEREMTKWEIHFLKWVLEDE